MGPVLPPFVNLYGPGYLHLSVMWDAHAMSLGRMGLAWAGPWGFVMQYLHVARCDLPLPTSGLPAPPALLRSSCVCGEGWSRSLRVLPSDLDATCLSVSLQASFCTGFTLIPSLCC